MEKVRSGLLYDRFRRAQNHTICKLYSDFLSLQGSLLWFLMRNELYLFDGYASHTEVISIYDCRGNWYTDAYEGCLIGASENLCLNYNPHSFAQ